jgi:DNA polymerase (family X)
VNAKAAVEAGVKLVISTDAHEVAHLEALELGVAQARRGWVTAGDVVNARPWAEARKLRKK